MNNLNEQLYIRVKNYTSVHNPKISIFIKIRKKTKSYKLFSTRLTIIIEKESMDKSSSGTVF